MSDMDVQTACTEAQNSCEDSDAGTDAGAGIPDYIVSGARQSGVPISNCFEGPINSSCTATVAQYAACITDETAAFITTVNGFAPCTTLTLAQSMNVNTAQSMMPASCTTLTSACGGLTQPDPIGF